LNVWGWGKVKLFGIGLYNKIKSINYQELSASLEELEWLVPLLLSTLMVSEIGCISAPSKGEEKGLMLTVSQEDLSLTLGRVGIGIWLWFTQLEVGLHVYV
jgi:hypothetical protein